MEKMVLTTGEIARHCGVNLRTVIRWIQKGRLKAFQLPGRGDNRVRLEDFLDFLRVHQMPTPEGLRTTAPRVLVVDDDPAIALAIEHLLRGIGCETKVAADGFSAGVLCLDYAPAVVTLDLEIPGLDGQQVIGFIRNTEAIRHLKILVVSAQPPEALAAALSKGADAVMAKPFSPEQLLAKVQSLL